MDLDIWKLEIYILTYLSNKFDTYLDTKLYIQIQVITI